MMNMKIAIACSAITILYLTSCAPHKPPPRTITLDLPSSRLGEKLRLSVPDPRTVEPEAFATAVVKSMSNEKLSIHAFELYPISRSPMQSNYQSKINHILLVYASRPLDAAVNTLFLVFSDKTGETATLVRAECYVNLTSERPCAGVLIPVPRRDGYQRLPKSDPVISPEECKVLTRQFLTTGPIEDLITISSRGITAFEESQKLERIDSIYSNLNGVHYSRYSDLTGGITGCGRPIEEISNGR